MLAVVDRSWSRQYVPRILYSGISTTSGPQVFTETQSHLWATGDLFAEVKSVVQVEHDQVAFIDLETERWSCYRVCLISGNIVVA